MKELPCKAWFGALALLLVLSAGSTARAGDRPNILWLVAEDMSAWLPCYGDSTVPTPNLDRLAAQSVRYTNAFASSPVCAPARSSLITGMYATRIGTLHMRTGKPSKAALEKDPDAYANIPIYEGVPPDFVRCFPELLRAAGYYCTNASKTDYQFKAPATVWDASGGKAHWQNRGDGQSFFAVFNHGGTHESQAFPESRLREQVVVPSDVPVPPLYPDTAAVRDALARTYNNIAAMDTWVGKKLQELDDAGLTDSTVVFFYSDHGVGLPRGKRSPYDLGTHVPLLVRVPGSESGGTVEERVVSFVDFGPSVLSLANLDPDDRLDGIPFLGPHKRPGNGYAFSHADRFDGVYDFARSVSDGRFRLVRNLDTDVPHLITNAYREYLPMMEDIYALREDKKVNAMMWQCASVERPAEEFYDSREDPWEVRNLASLADHQQKLEELRHVLDAWIEDTGDLGFVRPEKRMVEERLWHGDVQPSTEPATLRVEDGRVHLECATAGASIGHRSGTKGPWRVYSEPFPRDELDSIEVVAHRIGFRPAKNRIELP
ncbi:MAG: sulfatase [Planctomycetota bacterium]|nr:sulfatase [Planctomycetota bacterium]